MKRLSISGILAQHKLWLDSEGEDGTRACLSDTDLSGIDLSHANLSQAILCRTNLSGIDLSHANLSQAILCRTNLSGADLYEADLSKAQLFSANLFNANLSEANIYDAHLHGANIYRVLKKEIITFQGNKHFAYYADGLVKIGCICKKLEFWLENYEYIGIANRYSYRDIEVYGEWLHYIKRITA